VCTNYRLAIADKDALEVWYGELSMSDWSSRGTTLYQHQPPCQDPWTSTNVLIANLPVSSPRGVCRTIPCLLWAGDLGRLPERIPRGVR
jgi:hypothetical protein